MEARAIARWGCRHAAGRPALWCLAAALCALIPLCRALSPFPGLGLDPSGQLLRSWTAPATWVGASLALLFLTKHEAFLDLLPSPGRRAAELETLLLATFTVQACLLVGAAWSSLESPFGVAGELTGWLVACALLNVHIVAVGHFVLRAPLQGPARVALLWSLLWAVPAGLGEGWAATLCAPVQTLGALGLQSDLPRALLATFVSCLLFLLAAACIGCRPGRLLARAH